MPNPYFVNISTPFSSPLTADLTLLSLTEFLRKREEGSLPNNHETEKKFLRLVLKEEENKYDPKWSNKQRRATYANQLKTVTDLGKLCLSYLRNQAYTTSWNVGDQICEVCDLPNKWHRNSPYVWEFEPKIKLSIGLYKPPLIQTASDRDRAKLITIPLDEQSHDHERLPGMDDMDDGDGVAFCENTFANQKEIAFLLKIRTWRKKLQNSLNLYKPPKP